jgi:hypothetical protein
VSTLLHATVYVFLHILLNILVQTAKKRDLKKTTFALTFSQYKNTVLRREAQYTSALFAIQVTKKHRFRSGAQHAPKLLGTRATNAVRQ